MIPGAVFIWRYPICMHNERITTPCAVWFDSDTGNGNHYHIIYGLMTHLWHVPMVSPFTLRKCVLKSELKRILNLHPKSVSTAKLKYCPLHYSYMSQHSGYLMHTAFGVYSIHKNITILCMYVHSGKIWQVSWLLVAWLPMLPGHQQPLYWLSMIYRTLLSAHKDFNHLRNQWYKTVRNTFKSYDVCFSQKRGFAWVTPI